MPLPAQLTPTSKAEQQQLRLPRTAHLSTRAIGTDVSLPLPTANVFYRAYEKEGLRLTLEGLTGCNMDAHRLLAWAADRHGHRRAWDLLEGIYNAYHCHVRVGALGGVEWGGWGWGFGCVCVCVCACVRVCVCACVHVCVC